MGNIIFSIFWGPGILLAITGFGWFLSKLVCGWQNKLDFGLYAAFGLAGSTILGGLLNWAGLISSQTIFVFLICGIVLAIAYAIFELWPIRSGDGFFTELRSNKVFTVLFCILSLVVIFQYLMSVSPGRFNISDDYQAYLIFPEKMMQTGRLGNDPFSERRIITSLGGQYFLDTFVLAALPVKNIHLLDEGVGYLIFIFIFWGLLKEFGIARSLRCVLLIAILFSPLPTANITSLFVAQALFLATFWLFYRFQKNPDFSFRRALVVGIFIAGICSLKHNLIPVAGLLFAGYYIFLFKRYKFFKAQLLEFFMAGLLVFLFLLPWMLSMLHSSGTLLYPILGKGFHGLSYGTFVAPNSELFTLNGFLRVVFNLRELLFVCTAALAYCFFRAKFHLKEDLMLVTVILISVAVGTAVVIFATGSADTYRYVYAFVLAAFVILLTIGVSPAAWAYPFSKLGLNYAGAALIIAGVYFGGGLAKFLMTDIITASASQLKFLATNADITSPAERQEYKDLQLAIPAGETVLVRLDKNFLLDFRRNNIFINDSPGGASLPPGMPFFKGSEPLASYLLSSNIRYVAYSYKSQANFTRENFSDRLSPSIHVWIRTQARDYFDFQDNLAELGKSRKRIFDDGNIFVLDLGEKLN